ncbi:hypothetical protein [Zobellella aerophila]
MVSTCCEVTTPVSRTQPLISSAGVRSKAGLNTRARSGAHW